jgi:hypothetical protein
MHHGLLEAVAAYWRTPSVPADLRMLADQVVRDREAPTQKAVDELAEAVLSGRW